MEAKEQALLRQLQKALSKYNNALLSQKSFAKLRVLDLSGTPLTDLPEDISLLAALEVLDLSETKISVLPASIAVLSKLRMLILRDTQISYLPPEISKLQNLQILDLGYTPIEVFPISVASLLSLQMLNISYTNISELPREITALQKLVVFKLDKTPIRAIPPEITQMQRLRLLSIERTPIHTLPSTLIDLRPFFRDDSLQKKSASYGLGRGFMPIGIGIMGANVYGASGRPSLLSEMKDVIWQESAAALYDSMNSNPWESSILKHGMVDTKRLEHQLNSHFKEYKPYSEYLQLLARESPQEQQQHERMEFILQDIKAAHKRQEEEEARLQLERERAKEKEIKDAFGKIPEALTISIANALSSLDHETLTSSPKEAYDYLIGVQKEYTLLCEAKITLLGNGGAGKTSLREHWMSDGKPVKNAHSTQGVEIHDAKIEVGGDTYQLHFWDFGGQKTYHPFHTLFFSPKSIYIVLLDALTESKPDEWLHYISTFAENSPTILVINKVDERPRCDINASSYFQSHTNIYPQIFKLSCQHPEKSITPLPELQNAIKEVILNSIGDYRVRWPKSWVSVREKVLGLYRTEHMDFLTPGVFQRICHEYDIDKESQDSILLHLNRLGVALTFRNQYKVELSHVLNPNWVCDGIYKVLDADVRLDGIALPYSEFKRVLASDKRFCDDSSVINLLEIMKDRALCSDIQGTQNVFLPAILPEERPLEVPATETWNTIRFTFDFLPPALVHQLMVIGWKNINEATKPIAWRHGAVMWFEGVQAVLEEGQNTLNIHINPVKKGTEVKQVRFFQILLFETKRLIEGNHIQQSSFSIDVKIHIVKTEQHQLPWEYLPLQSLLTLEERGVREFTLPHTLHQIDVVMELRRYWPVIIEEVNKSEVRIEHLTITGPVYGPIGAVLKDSASFAQDNRVISETISSDAYAEILDLLERFIESELADDLTGRDIKKIKEVTKAAKKDGEKKGWERLRNFLEDVANITTIATPLVAFALQHSSEITDAAKAVFQVLQSMIHA